MHTVFRFCSNFSLRPYAKGLILVWTSVAVVIAVSLCAATFKFATPFSTVVVAAGDLPPWYKAAAAEAEAEVEVVGPDR